MAPVWYGDFGLRLPPGDEASLSLIRTCGEQPWFFRNFRVMRLAAFVPPWVANFQSGRGFASAPFCGRRDRMAPQNTGSGSGFAPAELMTMTHLRPLFAINQTSQARAIADVDRKRLLQRISVRRFRSS
jgi:hypothetical protein